MDSTPHKRKRTPSPAPSIDSAPPPSASAPPLAKPATTPRRHRLPFMGQVFDMVASRTSNELTRNNLSWSDDGKGLVIRDAKAFDETVLPVFFPNQTKRMASFMRSIHDYGFKRIGEKDGSLRLAHPSVNQQSTRDDWVALSRKIQVRKPKNKEGGGLDTKETGEGGNVSTLETKAKPAKKKRKTAAASVPGGTDPSAPAPEAAPPSHTPPAHFYPSNHFPYPALVPPPSATSDSPSAKSPTEGVAANPHLYASYAPPSSNPRYKTLFCTACRVIPPSWTEYAIPTPGKNVVCCNWCGRGYAPMAPDNGASDKQTVEEKDVTPDEEREDEEESVIAKQLLLAEDTQSEKSGSDEAKLVEDETTHIRAPPSPPLTPPIKDADELGDVDMESSEAGIGKEGPAPATSPVTMILSKDVAWEPSAEENAGDKKKDATAVSAREATFPFLSLPLSAGAATSKEEEEKKTDGDARSSRLRGPGIPGSPARRVSFAAEDMLMFPPPPPPQVPVVNSALPLRKSSLLNPTSSSPQKSRSKGKGKERAPPQQEKRERVRYECAYAGCGVYFGQGDRLEVHRRQFGH
ncbi:hypothetical protein MKEN_00980300 [Mycena kentingensis (nom. inval.)]|nr:hypothetical protein MKEN_00980300 [Mycena kentingensis (nom. inval.)]